MSEPSPAAPGRPDMIIVPSAYGWSLLVNDDRLKFEEALIASASTRHRQGLFSLATSLGGTVALLDESAD